MAVRPRRHVDTLPLHVAAYRRVFAELGLELRWSGFAEHAPSPAMVSIPGFIRSCGADPMALPEAKELHRRKKQAFADVLLTEAIPALPAAVPFAEALFGGERPVGVVTSGARDGVERILRRMGWWDALAVLVTGDEVACGKPHPEPYLTGAARLGVPPARCTAFEDTETGMRAALAAGMRVVDVSGGGR